nr:nucleoside recognition domain-containing protein [Oceanobacter mangrovi]
MISRFSRQTLPALAREIWSVYWTLFKLMVPVIVVVKLLEELGAIPLLSQLLAPLMSLVGLPETAGLVWATTMVTNIYGGMIVFFDLGLNGQLSVAQVTVLGGMMLVAHGLPVEVRIVQKSGVRLAVALAIRVVGALLYGALLSSVYQTGDWLQQPMSSLWQPEPQSQGLLAWAGHQIQSLLMILLVVAALISLLKLLRWMHVERAMIWLLQPLLRLLGISNQAASLTIVGMTLGLSFGGGLLIQEAGRGHIRRQDIFSAMLLLGLCHSLIEDTLLILLLGADISGVLWFRLGFALLVVALATRLLGRRSEQFWQRWLVYPTAAAATTATTAATTTATTARGQTHD